MVTMMCETRFQSICSKLQMENMRTIRQKTCCILLSYNLLLLVNIKCVIYERYV